MQPLRWAEEGTGLPGCDTGSTDGAGGDIWANVEESAQRLRCACSQPGIGLHSL